MNTLKYYILAGISTFLFTTLSQFGVCQNLIPNGGFEITVPPEVYPIEGTGELRHCYSWYDECDDRGADLYQENRVMHDGILLQNGALPSPSWGTKYVGFVPSSQCDGDEYAEMIQCPLTQFVPPHSLVKVKYRYAVQPYKYVGENIVPPFQEFQETGIQIYLLEELDTQYDPQDCDMDCDDEPDKIAFKLPEHKITSSNTNVNRWYNFDSELYFTKDKGFSWFAMRGILDGNNDLNYVCVDDIELYATDWCSHPCLRGKPNEPLEVNVVNTYFTPDGDGDNDVFSIRVSNAVYARLTIYYTQGEIQNRQVNFFIPNGMNNFNVYWDGKLDNGDFAGVGFYTYQLQLWRCGDYGKAQPTFEKVGGVTLLSGSGNFMGSYSIDYNNPTYFIENCCANTGIQVIEPLRYIIDAECCPETLVLKNMTLTGTHLYKAGKHILVENCTVPAGANITLKAGWSIDGIASVTVANGAIFDAIMENPCPNSGRMANPNPLANETAAAPPPFGSVVPSKPKPPALPAAFKTETTGSDLFANVPNPFRAQTKIGYQIGSPGPVTLTLYNATGVPVSTLVNEAAHSSGVFEIPFDASHLSEGTYFYTLRAGAFSRTRSMVVLR